MLASQETEEARLRTEETARHESQRQEAALLDAERLAAQRVEEARLAAEWLEFQRQKADRLEAERLEARHQETARLEAERLATQLAALKQEPKDFTVRSFKPDPITDPAPPDPDRLIAQLSRVYANGDLNGLISLFTPDAKVSRGQGRAYIRADYGQFFAKTSYRQLEVRGIRWKTNKGGRLSGKGKLFVRVLMQRERTWKQLTGWISFELVDYKGEYKIARMEHQMD